MQTNSFSAWHEQQTGQLTGQLQRPDKAAVQLEERLQRRELGLQAGEETLRQAGKEQGEPHEDRKD